MRSIIRTDITEWAEYRLRMPAGVSYEVQCQSSADELLIAIWYDAGLNPELPDNTKFVEYEGRMY